jgi:leucyl-tRNA synthetase
MARYYNEVKINKLSDYYYHWTNALYSETHYPRNTAFKKLINSGNISIMKNKKIMSSLLAMKTLFKEIFAIRKHVY